MVWTKSEIEIYKRIRDKDLDLFYNLEGISIEETEKRRICLINKLDLTKDNKYYLKKVGIKKGNAVQLRALEKMAKEYLFMVIN